MRRESLDIYVTQIGGKRINIRGNNLKKLSKYQDAEKVESKVSIGGAEKTITTLVLSFKNELEKLELLQELINMDVPFCDDFRSTAYMDACALIEQGKLKGKILGC